MLCHDPGRAHMRGLPGRPLPDLAECLDANLEVARLTSPDVRAVGVCLNTSALDRDAARALCASTADAARPALHRPDRLRRRADHRRAAMPRTLRAQHDRFALSAPVPHLARREDRGGCGDGDDRRRRRRRARRGRALSALWRERRERARRRSRRARARSRRARTARRCWRCCPPARRATRSIAPCGISRRGCRARRVAALIGAPEPAPLATALTIGIDTPAAMAAAAARDRRRAAAQGQGRCDRSRGADPRGARRGARRRADRRSQRELGRGAARGDAAGAGRGAGRICSNSRCRPDADDWLEGFDAGGADLRRRIGACRRRSRPRRARAIRHVNVKLDKTGGLTAALELAQAARARGLGLMTGCMVSSSLSIAPALHVARMSRFRRS